MFALGFREFPRILEAFQACLIGYVNFNSFLFSGSMVVTAPRVSQTSEVRGNWKSDCDFQSDYDFNLLPDFQFIDKIKGDSSKKRNWLWKNLKFRKRHWNVKGSIGNNKLYF